MGMIKGHNPIGLLILLAMLLIVAACGPTSASGGKAKKSRAPSLDQSWLTDSTLLSLYGRAFGREPVLGRLGDAQNFADVAEQLEPYQQTIRNNNGGKSVLLGIQLIYADAAVCQPGFSCLSYLDDTGINVVKEYIEPAARLGWLVILDDRLGRSHPVAEIKHMISKGYLLHDNVEVAFDPQFHARPGQITPGDPPGNVGANELNQAQGILSRYCMQHHLVHRKLMLIHQRDRAMIRRREALRSDLSYVDPVMLMDATGPPGQKARAYRDLLGPGAGGVKWRGIELFYPNPSDPFSPSDHPIMGWDQVFGRASADAADGKPYWVDPAPSVVVIS